MLMCELNRISSHFLFLATNGMDLGAISMILYGWRARDLVLQFFEKTSGLRMNHNYIRPGGVAADLPDGWRDDLAGILDALPARLGEYDSLMTAQPIWQGRTQGVGVITPEEALALGTTGPPILRSTGTPWDLRKDMPYLAYDQVEFDVVVGSYGDVFDRYAIRLNEIRESMRIVAQILDAMPGGDYRVQDKKVTPPPRARIDESMEALIHHFKIFTEGFRVPEGEVYVAVESPRGELGCYLVSDGSAKPYRLHIRGPSFVNLQTLPHMLRGGLIADAVAIISSVDPIMGEVDRWWPARAHGRAGSAFGAPGEGWIADGPVDERERGAGAGDHRPLPPVALGVDPPVARGPGTGRMGEHRGHEPHRRAARPDPGRGVGHGQLLRHVQAGARGPLRGQRVHQHLLPPGRGRRAARALRGTPRGQGRRHHPRRGVHPRGRGVHRRLHRRPLSPGELPLLPQHHPRRGRQAPRRPSGRTPRRGGATARDPDPGAPARPAERWSGHGAEGLPVLPGQSR